MNINKGYQGYLMSEYHVSNHPYGWSETPYSEYLVKGYQSYHNNEYKYSWEMQVNSPKPRVIRVIRVIIYVLSQPITKPFGKYSPSNITLVSWVAGL